MKKIIEVRLVEYDGDEVVINPTNVFTRLSKRDYEDEICKSMSKNKDGRLYVKAYVKWEDIV